jgi:hypothetical protein
MRFHEVRQFTVPGINFNEAVPGTDPVTGKPSGAPPTPGIVDRIKGFFGANPAPAATPTAPAKPSGPTAIGFQSKLRQIATALGVEAEHLLKVMRFETAGTLNPAIQSGSGTGATGLIQFMPKIAASLGTSTAQLAQMSAEQQLEYVYQFYKTNKLPPGSSLSDIYLYTYMPAVMRTGKPDTFVLGKKGAYGKKIWSVDLGKNWDKNSAFANEAKRNKRNYFTVGDVRNVINRF